VCVSLPLPPPLFLSLSLSFHAAKTAGGQLSNQNFNTNPQQQLIVEHPATGPIPVAVHFHLTRNDPAKTKQRASTSAEGGGGGEAVKLKGKNYATAVHLLNLSHKLVGEVSKRQMIGAAVFTDQQEHVCGARFLFHRIIHIFV
jgi:hypothetical protein